MHSKDSQTRSVKRALAALAERFGIDPGYFTPYRLYLRKNQMWCCTPEAGKASFPRIQRRGLRLARVFENAVRPTTNAIQLFGHLVKRSRLELTEAEQRRFIAGKTQEVEVPEEVTEGFVVAFYEGRALGIGLLKKNKLKSQVPRSRRILG